MRHTCGPLAGHFDVVGEPGCSRATLPLHPGMAPAPVIMSGASLTIWLLLTNIGPPTPSPGSLRWSCSWCVPLHPGLPAHTGKGRPRPMAPAQARCEGLRVSDRWMLGESGTQSRGQTGQAGLGASLVHSAAEIPGRWRWLVFARIPLPSTH